MLGAKLPLAPLEVGTPGIGGDASRRRPCRLYPCILCAATISSGSGRAAWSRHGNSATPQQQRPRRRGERQVYISQEVDMKALVSSLSKTTTAEELHAVMSPYVGTGGGGTPQPRLSPRFITSLISHEADWRRSLALLDWMVGAASYRPTVFAYNVVIRNVLRAGQWQLAAGLVDEMARRHGVPPDRFTYATVISALGKAGHLDAALAWLHCMERDGIRPDLVLYSSLIELSRRLGDHSKAISLFSRLRASGIAPDLVAYNSMINVYGKAGLLREARQLLDEMIAATEDAAEPGGVAPDTVSYSTLLTAYIENTRYIEALSLFSEMRERRVPLNLTTCNIIIDIYGQLGMGKEADSLFWSMPKLGVQPSTISYNTLLRVYGEAELFGEAIHLFRLMQSKGVEQNVVTYNTMISIYGKTLEHEKAGNLITDMQLRGIVPNAITYSTIISIWCKAGRLDRAAKLFQKIRTSGVDIDKVLYETMIAAYEKAGLVGHAKRLLRDLRHPEEDGGVSKETAVSILANAGRVEEATYMFRQAFDDGQLKDIAVFKLMMELFARNNLHGHVVEVFEKMGLAGYYPDSDMIGMALNAYGKLRDIRKAETVYRELQEEGCVFADNVHFQMLSLLGARRDFVSMEALFESLASNPNIDKKQLHLVTAGIYERANRLGDASRIIAMIER